MFYREPIAILSVNSTAAFFRVLWSDDLIRRWANNEFTHQHLHGFQDGVCAFSDPYNVLIHANASDRPDTLPYARFQGRVIQYIGHTAEAGAYIVDVVERGNKLLSYNDILDLLNEEDRKLFSL